MTEMHDSAAPDPEDFVVSWMSAVMRSATERATDDELPFAIVQFITGSDSADEGTFDGVVQIDYLDRDGTCAIDGHRRMLYLAQHVPDVTLSDGSVANCDYLTTIAAPHRMDYFNERVKRYTARYQLGLSFVAADFSS